MCKLTPEQIEHNLKVYKATSQRLTAKMLKLKQQRRDIMKLCIDEVIDGPTAKKLLINLRKSINNETYMQKQKQTRREKAHNRSKQSFLKHCYYTAKHKPDVVKRIREKAANEQLSPYERIVIHAYDYMSNDRSKAIHYEPNTTTP